MKLPQACRRPQWETQRIFRKVKTEKRLYRRLILHWQAKAKSGKLRAQQ